MRGGGEEGVARLKEKERKWLRLLQERGGKRGRSLPVHTHPDSEPDGRKGARFQFYTSARERDGGSRSSKDQKRKEEIKRSMRN